MENEIVDQTAIIERRRPTFLTVLCIITFAVSAYYIFDGLLTIFVAESFDTGQWQTIMDQMNQALDEADPQSAKFLESFMGAVSETIERSINHATTLGLASLLVALISAYGSYLMFQMKRMGFSIYTGAKILGLMVPMVILGFNVVTIIAYSFAAFIGLIFIIMYGVNRKYMS
jgi:hypothetical protein